MKSCCPDIDMIGLSLSTSFFCSYIFIHTRYSKIHFRPTEKQLSIVKILLMLCLFQLKKSRTCSFSLKLLHTSQFPKGIPVIPAALHIYVIVGQSLSTTSTSFKNFISFFFFNKNFISYLTYLLLVNIHVNIILLLFMQNY